MASIYDWSKTAGDNSNSDTGINWQEGQPPSTVNNSARAMMGRLAEYIEDMGGSLSVSGSVNSLTVNAGSGFTQYANGISIRIRAANTNTGPATLNVNAIGSKTIRKFDVKDGEVALEAGDIRAGGIYDIAYSELADGGSGGWVVLNPSGAGGSGIAKIWRSTPDAGDWLPVQAGTIPYDEWYPHLLNQSDDPDGLISITEEGNFDDTFTPAVDGYITWTSPYLARILATTTTRNLRFFTRVRNLTDGEVIANGTIGYQEFGADTGHDIIFSGISAGSCRVEAGKKYQLQMRVSSASGEVNSVQLYLGIDPDEPSALWDFMHMTFTAI